MYEPVPDAAAGGETVQSLFLTPSEKELALPIYLTSVGYRPQFAVERPDGLPDFHWLHTVRGSGVVELGGATRTLREGQGFLMFPGVPHRYFPQGEWDTMWLTWNGAGMAGFLSAWGLATGFYNLVDTRASSRLIEDLLVVGLKHSPLQSAELSTLTYRFLVELCRQATLSPAARHGQERLRPLLDYISENLHTQLTLSEMAQLLDITPQHLCRLFQRTLGMTPLTYITNLRVSRAKSLLIDEPYLPVAEVARRVGFSNHSYFCSVFKARERKTPTEFRAVRLGTGFFPPGGELRPVENVRS